MRQSLICRLLALCMFLVGTSWAAHPPSPCPDIFTYEGSEPENNRWYGEISLRTDESLVGIRLDIELDRPADLMVSWMGEITTTDNVKYTVLNLNQKLRPGPAVLSRIMVKFNRSTGSPKVRFIRLNGRKICPEDTSFNTEYEEPAGPPRPQNPKRPDPEFGLNYGDSEYPTSSGGGNSNSNSNSNSRPNAQPTGNGNSDYSSNDNRPAYRPSTTSTTEGPYTTRKTAASKVTTTTARAVYEANDNRPNKNNSPNTVSLQASSTDSNREINGVINGLLQNNQNSNKTVIITVIDNNNNNNNNNDQQPYRPNANNGGDDSEQSRPPTNSNRPGSPSSNQQRPNGGSQGGSSGGINSQQLSSGTGSCGVVKLAVPLVTAGQSTHRGQWPWHVALYMIEGINLSYHCGGSLVSKNKVVTAAHCVTNRQNDVIFNSSRIVIYLGKYHQLQYGDDLGVQTKQVIRINVYPSYNSSNYLGDIAVLTLSSDAEYTNYVTPVCLWDERSDDVNDIVGKDGTVVGWGFDENDTPTEELKMAKMPVVSHQTCLWSYPQFYSEFTSDKTFCAGFRNGTSVCNGDSGGGMVFNKNSKWYLRGIVSITVAKEGLRVCDTRHYVVFTDVAKYLDFVRKNLR